MAELTIGEVARVLEAVHESLRDHEARIEELEKNDVATRKDIAHVAEKVDRIDANLVWLVRLLVGAIVTGGIAVAWKAF